MKNFKMTFSSTDRHAGADDTEPIRLPPLQHFHCNRRAQVKAALSYLPKIKAASMFDTCD